MNPAQLTPQPEDLPQLLLGLVLWLLPGLALGDRLWPGKTTAWALAPVLSFTTLSLAGVLLEAGLDVPVRSGGTAALALALATAAGAPRIAQWISLQPPRPRPATSPSSFTPRRLLRPLALLAVLGFVAFAHALPHAPGPDVAPAAVYGELAQRSGQLLQGDGYGFPVHVDEHTHIAYAAAIVRTGHPVDPYRPHDGDDRDTEPFTLRGSVHERAFQLGLAQMALLGGASLVWMTLWLPAVWAATLALLLLHALRGLPGNWIAAASVAALPTDVLFMGSGFLVPIAFGLAWLPAIAITLRTTTGLPRIALTLLLVTAAFFVHLVIGAVALLLGVLCALALDLSRRRRVALVGACLAPLLWVLPPLRLEILQNTQSTATHPLGEGIFLTFGWALCAAALLGVTAAHARPEWRAARPWAWTLFILGATMGLSQATGTTSLALYYRLVHPAALALAACAGLGLGVLVASLRTATRRPTLAGAFAVTATALALLTPVQAHLETEYYRIHDTTSWQAAQAFAAAQPRGVFLSEPWHAMLFAAVSGAEPWTVLHPGAAPPRGQDWQDYVGSGGKDAQWLDDRGIAWVLGPPPNAPHVEVAPGVYRIT